MSSRPFMQLCRPDPDIRRPDPDIRSGSIATRGEPRVLRRAGEDAGELRSRLPRAGRVPRRDDGRGSRDAGGGGGARAVVGEIRRRTVDALRTSGADQAVVGDHAPIPRDPVPIRTTPNEVATVPSFNATGVWYPVEKCERCRLWKPSIQSTISSRACERVSQVELMHAFDLQNAL